MKGIRVVLAGGGSSNGHIMPLVAVARALHKAGVELLWIGDAGSRAEELAREAEVAFRTIPIGKLRRYFALANLATPFQYWAGVRTARTILAEFAPDAVFTKGGAIGLPVAVAAHQLGIPVVIHESDAVMGLANRRAAGLAAKICVSFPIESFPDLPRDKLVVTGVPVRNEFLTVKRRPHRRPRLLVTGGGQGSLAINQVVWTAVPELTKIVDVIHLTGTAWETEAANYARDGYQSIGYTVAEMAQLVADADLVLARASGTTLAELAVVGRPAILVPLPNAANDHQRANAAVWERAGAALVIEQVALTPVALVAAVQAIIGNTKRAATMARAARLLAQPNATKKIIDVLARVV